MTLQEILAHFDNPSNKGFSEYEVSSQLHQLFPEDKSTIDETLKSEFIAFELVEDYPDTTTGWGRYFGPMVVNYENGMKSESPSIKHITSQMVSYWEQRANESTHPILIARYCALVWDFKETITNIKPSHQYYTKYIQAVINIANGDYSELLVSTIAKLNKALNHAISMNNSDLINQCKDAIINYENKHSKDTQTGLWGYSYDLLVKNKKVQLADFERTQILGELEQKLDRLTSKDSNQIDPWAAQEAAERLANYYKGDNTHIRRVVLKVGEAVEKIANELSPIQLSGIYDNLYKFYQKFGLTDESKNLLLKIKDLESQVISELTTFSHSIEFPLAELDKEIEDIISGNIPEVLVRICHIFTPNIQQSIKEIYALANSSPLLYIMPHGIQDDSGRKIATIGPLDDDLEGHIILHISRSLSYNSITLRRIFEKLAEKEEFETQFFEFISQTPIFRQDRLEVIKKGIEAHFSGDYLVAIHLLIPQIEQAIRNIVEFQGGLVLKQTKSGGYQLITLDDVLRDRLVENLLGKDVTNYLKILLTNPKGWNVRNNVCHGILSHNKFNSQLADRIMHTLIILGMVRHSEQNLNEI